MKCHYCQQLLYSPVEETDKIFRWECEPCGANYRFLKGGGLVSITWKNIVVNGQQFFIKSYSGVTGNAPQFVIYYYAINEDGVRYWDEVKRFDFIPKDWTPQNVAHKLKTYLPFL